MVDDIRVRGVAKACSHTVASLIESTSPSRPVTVSRIVIMIVQLVLFKTFIKILYT